MTIQLLASRDLVPTGNKCRERSHRSHRELSCRDFLGQSKCRLSTRSFHDIV